MNNAETPLASWHEGKAKDAITNFVAAVTNQQGDHYVAPPERIAVFDNDGTLWSEHPWYFQLYFARDRIRQAVAAHPEWERRQPFKAALEGDLKTLAEGGEQALLEVLAATHEGLTTEAFAQIVLNWINTAKHENPPGGGERLYKQMVFQPMLELLQYLRANEFKTFIVSGGGLEFVRPWAEEVYGVPPEQVVGSHIGTTFHPDPIRVGDNILPEATKPDSSKGEPCLRRTADYIFIDDKAGKPVGIHRFIGRRPIAAFGNSTGDQRMLEWVTYGDGLRFGLIVKHDDGSREFDYETPPDNASPCGVLHQTTLNEAADQGWTVVSMANDWKQIYPDV